MQQYFQISHVELRIIVVVNSLDSIDFLYSYEIKIVDTLLYLWTQMKSETIIFHRIYEWLVELINWHWSILMWNRMKTPKVPSFNVNHLNFKLRLCALNLFRSRWFSLSLSLSPTFKSLRSCNGIKGCYYIGIWRRNEKT